MKILIITNISIIRFYRYIRIYYKISMDIIKKMIKTHKYTWEKNIRNDKKNNRKFEIIFLKKLIYIYIYMRYNLSYLIIILCVDNKYEFYKYIFTIKLY